MNLLPVSIIIPTMNRPESLDRTLNGYACGTHLPSQVVIVDQTNDPGKKEGMEKTINDFKDRLNITYYFQDQPSSTKARNIALGLASQDVLVFSDDDVDVFEDTLKKVYDVMKDKTVAMLAGIDDLHKKSKSNIGYLLGSKSFKNRKIGNVTKSVLSRYPDNIKGQIETQWAMGYFFVVRKSLVEKWGIRWDERLVKYAHAEDLDFSFAYYKRAKAENLRCILDEQIHVKHLASQEYRIPNKTTTYMYVINRAYLYYKHEMGKGTPWLMKWCNFWMTVRRVVIRQNAKDMRSARKIVNKLKGNILNVNLEELYQ